jgi:hypothetical protein
MPPCKNDKTRSYKGDEPSPKGLGFCAHAEPLWKERKGRDGRKWEVREDAKGVKSWKPATGYQKPAKVPDFSFSCSSRKFETADMDAPLGTKQATLVVPLYDVGVPESERSVQIKNAKGLTMRDLGAGLDALMAKKLSDASIAKLSALTDTSWLASMFSKYDTVGSHLPRHNIFKATRSAGKLCLSVDS